MTLALDSIVVTVHDLNRAMQDYRELGFTVTQRGTTLNDGAESALIAFADGTALELRAGIGDEGLVGFVLRADDLDAEVARLLVEGFVLSEITPVDYRLENGTLTQRRVVRVDHYNYDLWLFQEVTPRQHRLPTDSAFITHANHAVGISSLMIIVRRMQRPWDWYTRLLNMTPNHLSSNYRELDRLILYEAPDLGYYERRADHLLMFGGRISRAEIDAADPALEPRKFSRQRAVQNEALERRHQEFERASAMNALVKTQHEGLFSIYLKRESPPDDRFVLEKTHGVRFQQVTGTTPYQGDALLVGLDAFHWKAVSHAYGPAVDVPDLLRQITSQEKAVRDHAYEVLNGTIVHQGTVYEASVDTIPFLLKLIEDPAMPDKHRVIDLCGAIISGALQEPALAVRVTPFLKPALSVYLSLIDHPESLIRSFILSGLSLFSDAVDTIEPVFRAKVLSDPDADLRAAALRSLIELWRVGSQHALTDSQTAYLSELFRDSSQPIGVQFEAGFALLQVDSARWVDEGMALFHRMMTVPEADLNLLVHGRAIFYRLYWVLKDTPERALAWIEQQSRHDEPNIRQLIPGFMLHFSSNQALLDAFMPIFKRLMADSDPDVRHAAVGFFYTSPAARQVVGELEDIAQNDQSLTIRVVAQNCLNNLARQS